VKIINLREILSLNIKAFRAEEGLSQDEFAARCGLHRTYIGSVERQERNVTLETLNQLSTAMGVSAADLLTPQTREVSAGE
jgi:transcriptional regulator with XRE-family HTH domain